MPAPLVLCYHALSADWPAALSTTPERFRRQLELLVERGYRGVTFTDAVAGDARGERVVAVTFDDAFRSVLELGRPILDELGIPATVFVPTDFIDRDGPLRWPGIDQWLDGPYEHELAHLTWDELRELADAGWEIGAHTGSHPRLTQLDDDALASELTRSKQACERRLGRPCTSMAYPYGDVDARVVAATRAAGYRTAAALPCRLDGEDPLEWPRVGIYRSDDERRFRLKVSPLVARARRSRAWSIVDGARRRLQQR